jgi:hypothetical protein
LFFYIHPLTSTATAKVWSFHFFPKNDAMPPPAFGFFAKACGVSFFCTGSFFGFFAFVFPSDAGVGAFSLSVVVVDATGLGCVHGAASGGNSVPASSTHTVLVVSSPVSSSITVITFFWRFTCFETFGWFCVPDAAEVVNASMPPFPVAGVRFVSAGESAGSGDLRFGDGFGAFSF